MEHTSKLNFLFFLSVLILISCTPEKKVKALSFFFDGVVKETPKDSIINKKIDKNVDLTNKAIIKDANSNTMISFHKPYKERKCDKCHDTKSSNILVTKKKNLCFKCHKEKNFTGKFVHGPVIAGKCLTCHLPHESGTRKLLAAKGKKLCLACHNEKDVENIKNHKGLVTCLDCHSPHVGDNNYFLKNNN